MIQLIKRVRTMHIVRQAEHLLFCILIILIKTALYVLHIIYRNILRNKRERKMRNLQEIYIQPYTGSGQRVGKRNFKGLLQSWLEK